MNQGIYHATNLRSPEARACSKVPPQAAPSGALATESGERRGEHKRGSVGGSVGTTYSPTHETDNDNIIISKSSQNHMKALNTVQGVTK